MQLPLVPYYETCDEDGPCAPYFTGHITDADGRVMCRADSEERAIELVDCVDGLSANIEALRARLAEVEKENEKLTYNMGVFVKAYRATKKRLAEVEAQMIEHANNSAAATTLFIEADGKLNDAMLCLKHISNMENNVYYGTCDGISVCNLDAAKKFATKALAKLEEPR